MKLPLLPSAVLAATLSSCGDSASSKSAQAVPAKAVIAEEKPDRPASNATRSDYSVSDLVELGKLDVFAFMDALKVWIPSASDDDLAQLYAKLPSDRSDTLFGLIIAHDAVKALDFAVRHVKGRSSSVCGIQAFEAILKASPAAALRNALNLSPGELRNLAFSALFGSGGWRSQKKELISRIGELYEDEQSALGTALAGSASDLGLLETDLGAAPRRTREAFVTSLAKRWVMESHGSLDSLTTQLPVDLRATATDSYFTELSVKDPQSALSMAERMGRNDVNVAASYWAMSDPVAAVEYFAVRPHFEAGLSRVFDYWIIHEPIEASTYAASQLSGRAAELAAVEIAQDCLRHGDKTGAERWLQRISDPVLRTRATSR
jgi:hypothetical protein